MAEPKGLRPAADAPESDPVPRSGPESRRHALAYDVLLAVLLFAFALWVRRSEPHDGLFWDDAWQAFASTKASFSQLYIAGQTQPGFTVLLAMWSRVFGAAPSTLVLPAKIAGALGPFALYLVLRWFRYSRSVAFLMGALLAVNTAHVFHSTRVKSYTADVIIVLLIAMLVDRLCSNTWNSGIALGWIAIAITAAAMTAIGPLVVVAAGLIIVLHSRHDLWVRVIAVGIQLVVTAVYVVAIERTFNGTAEKHYWIFSRGFIEFSANPVHFSRDIARHMVRVTQAFPGGPQPWPDVVLVVVVVGLAFACWRGRRAIATRFLVLAALLAMAASVVQRVPFAPLGSGIEDTRVTLWLVPLVAFGLAEVLDLVRTKTARRELERRVFDGLVAVIAICVAFTAIGTPPQYPDGGAAATQYVMTHLAPTDVVWVTAAYPFAVSAGAEVRFRASTHDLVGFRPEFADPRLVLVAYMGPDQLRDSVARATRVWLVLDAVNFYIPKLRSVYEAPLKQYGFVQSSITKIRSSFVERWDLKT